MSCEADSQNATPPGPAIAPGIEALDPRAIAAQLAGPERFFVVFIDALQVLDINNLTYADVALALAEVLAERVEQAGIAVPEVFLTPCANGSTRSPATRP